MTTSFRMLVCVKCWGFSWSYWLSCTHSYLMTIPGRSYPHQDWMLYSQQLNSKLTTLLTCIFTSTAVLLLLMLSTDYNSVWVVRPHIWTIIDMHCLWLLNTVVWHASIMLTLTLRWCTAHRHYNIYHIVYGTAWLVVCMAVMTWIQVYSVHRFYLVLKLCYTH